LLQWFELKLGRVIGKLKADMRSLRISLSLLLLLIPILVGLTPINLSVKAVAQVPEGQKAEADRTLKSAVDTLRIGSPYAAQQQLEQALQLYKAIADPQGQQAALTHLGLAYYRQGRYPQALAVLQQADQFPGNWQQQGQRFSLRGMISLQQGDYWSALQHLQRAEGSQRSDIAAENRTQIALGETYHYLGLYNKALPYLEIAQKTPGDRIDLGWALQALGDLQFDLGEYQQAQDYYQQGLHIRRAVGDRLGTARSLSSLGLTYQQQNQFEAALAAYQEALSVITGLGDDTGRVYLLNYLSRAYLAQGQNQQALDYLQQALATTQRLNGTGRALTLTSLGNYHRQLKQYQQAVDFYGQAVGWARQNGDRVGEAKALSGLGETLLESGKSQQATPMLQASLEVFESLRPGLRDQQKISLFETQTHTYALLQKALINQNRQPEALVAAERGRARAFVELLAQRLSNSPLPKREAPPTVASIQAIAKKQQATLVTYSLLHDSTGQETDLYIWVVSPTGEISFRGLDLSALETNQAVSVSNLARQTRVVAGRGSSHITNLVASLRGSVTEARPPNPPDFSVAQNGYQLLIKPIAELLPTDPNARIILVPQGALFLVPFAALQDAAGQFLIQKHTLSIAPSLQSLSLVNPRSTTNKSALIVGNPTPMPFGLSALPAAEQEAKTIAQILNTQALTGTQATETQVLQQISQAGLIHLATHGLLDGQQGLNSSLAFVADQQHNGLLTAAEILDLKLQADLAVLSACDTGRGKITGDGVVGLSRSLMSAGVNSVVVSLWAVPDLPTAQLMTEFYRQRQAQKLDKAQALRQAMLTMIKQDPNPRNWAGFILIGQVE
jgi:CHAT domain-containing protein/Flp pilus assembly protein TadD